MNSLNDIIKHKTRVLFTPKWLQTLTYGTPSSLIKRLIEHHLNHTFKSQINDGELEFLIDKCICIEIKNIPLNLFISLDNSSKKVQVLVLKSNYITQNMTRFDGKLSGSSDSFLQLISGQSDPDTLFFRRQLTIEGDTELCLIFKNWLDTQDPHSSLPTTIYSSLQDYVASAIDNT